MNKVYWFSLFTVAGLAVHFLKYYGSLLPDTVRFYLNDLLIVPITAILSLWLMQLIFKRSNMALRKWQVVYIVLFYSIIFEAILPMLILRYTGDWLDIVMYISGGVFYWKIINRS